MSTQNTRRAWWLIAGIAGASSIGFLIHTFPPTGIPQIIAFFALTLVTLYFILRFIVANNRWAILASAGISIFLILRMFQLREPLYLILLAAALVSLELVFHTR